MKSMTTDPLLTIAIPTFNGHKTILESLDSCLDGVSSKIEILIGDNGSEDLTKQTVLGWIERHKADFSIHYHRHERNIGYDKNILSLFQNANGKFVHILADDDAFYPGAIVSLIKILEEHEDIGGIVSNFDHYDTNLKTIVGQLTINNKNPISHSLADFITDSAGRFGQVSTLTLNRKMVTELDSSQLIGTQYIHIYLAFKIVLAAGIYINSKPILKIRAGSPNFEKKGDDKILVPLGSIKIFRSFKKEINFRFYWKYVLQYSIYLAKSVYGGKKQGLKYPAQTFLKLFKHEYHNPFFWIMIVPVFFIPSKLISLLKNWLIN